MQLNCIYIIFHFERMKGPLVLVYVGSCAFDNLVRIILNCSTTQMHKTKAGKAFFSRFHHLVDCLKLDT